MRLNESVPVPKGACPYCAALLDVAAGADEAHTPKPGDVTVCIECAEPLVFNDDMRVRKPDPLEARQLAADERLQAMRQALRDMHAAHGRRLQ